MKTSRSRIFMIGAATAVAGTAVAYGIDRFLLPLVTVPEIARGLVVGGGASAVTLAVAGYLARDLARTMMQHHAIAGDTSGATMAAIQRSWLRRPAAWALAPVLEFESDERRKLITRSETAEQRVREIDVQLRIAESDREELEGILHALRDAVLVIDGFGDLVMANDAAVKMFNLDLERSIDHPIGETIHDREIVRLVNEARDSGSPSYRRLVEHRVETNRKSEVHEISLASVSHADGEVAGVVMIFHDVTTEREISDMKSDFVSKASHELKTPLSGIKAYIEMLIDGEADDEASRNEFYNIIQNEADRLGRLIESMLNISRIEAGIIQTDWVDLNLADLVDEVLEFMQSQAHTKKITLNAKRPPQAVMAEVDRNLVQQVITNLVSNAIKYTPEGGRVTVTSALADCDQSAMIAVSDTGLGISPDDIPKLFDKFYRIENYKRVAKGTGLGLNLVKQIVETVHKGEIGVESQLGLGSKFWFSLPCRRQSRAAA
ncbi:MAG: sensor histidine kinase [Planctomycetota bacterium]